MGDVGTADGSPWELRVHGVAGTTAESMLEVGADTAEYGLATGLELARPRVVPPHRRSFSWGALTSGKPSHAFNVLLLPFMLANVAGWMLPSLRRGPEADPVGPPSRKARGTTAVVRLHGLAITVLWAVFVALAFLDVTAAIIGGRPGAWIGFLLALIVVTAVALFTTVVPRDPGSPLWPRDIPMVVERTRTTWFDLDQDALWSTPQAVAHNHRPHMSVALAVIAAAVCGPVVVAGTASTWEIVAAWVGLVLAGACLLVAAVVLVRVSWSAGDVLPLWCSAAARRWTAWLAGFSVVGAALVVPELPVDPDTTLPGLRGALAVVGAVALVGFLAVGFSESRKRPEGTTMRQAWTGASLLLLAAGVGAVYGAGFLLFGLGTLERLLLGGAKNTLASIVLPASLDWVAVTYLLVALCYLAVLGIRFARIVRVQPADVGSRPMAAVRQLVRRPAGLLVTLGLLGAAGVVALIVVGWSCTEPTTTIWGRQLQAVDAATCLGIASADVVWLLAGLLLVVVAVIIGTAFRARWALLVAAGLGLVGLALALGALVDVVDVPWVPTWRPPSDPSLSAVALTVAFTSPAAAIVTRVFSATRDRSTRRGIAVLWDLSLFWPRWFHPFAQRSYSDTAVSGLAGLLVRRGAADAPTVLAPHSQGSVIAVPACLLAEANAAGSLRQVALLTYGSPVRQLYSEVFPGMFTPGVVARLVDHLSSDGHVRWRNLWRTTDPIGGPMSRPEDDAVPAVVDALSRPEGDGLRDPAGRLHSGYWAEPEYQQALDALWPLVSATFPPPVPGPAVPPGPGDGGDGAEVVIEGVPPLDVDASNRRTVEGAGRRFDVVSAGEGPPVVLLHELHGVTDGLLGLAGVLMANGFTVHVPLLYGDTQERGTVTGAVMAVRCLRRDLALFTTGGRDGLAGWLDSLVDELAEPDGPGVAVIGMCMTGGVVLGTLANPNTAAVVSSQPSVPMHPWSPIVRADLGLSPDRIEAAAAAETPLLCLRYRDDPLCSDARLVHIGARLGVPPGEWTTQNGLRLSTQGPLVTIEVPGRKHSVLTADRVDAALVRAVQFLAEHLQERDTEGGWPPSGRERT